MSLYSPLSMSMQHCQYEMEWEYSWLNDLQDQRLGGNKEEGDCKEGDDDFKLKVGGKLWKRARERSYGKWIRTTMSMETLTWEALVSPGILGPTNASSPSSSGIHEFS